MMTLIAFLLGLGVITAIARYNESDSLFWKLAIAYIGSFGAAKVVTSVMDNKEQDKVVMISDSPTQVQQSISCIPYTLAEMSLLATKREKSPKPVSKDTVTNTSDSILSEVFVSARGQPYTCAYFDDS